MRITNHSLSALNLRPSGICRSCTPLSRRAGAQPRLENGQAPQPATQTILGHPRAQPASHSGPQQRHAVQALKTQDKQPHTPCSPGLGMVLQKLGGQVSRRKPPPARGATTSAGPACHTPMHRPPPWSPAQHRKVVDTPLLRPFHSASSRLIAGTHQNVPGARQTHVLIVENKLNAIVGWKGAGLQPNSLLRARFLLRCCRQLFARSVPQHHF